MAAPKSNFNLFKLIAIQVSFALAATNGFASQDFLSENIPERVYPYLLPEDHPAKDILDSIFSSSRAILNLKSMEEAGFISPKPREKTHVIVCKHKDLPGYVIKAYLDSQRYFGRIKEYDHWINRITGVSLVAEEIQKNGWEQYFKTPKKWIYALPKHPSPPREFIRKHFILIEEDMDLLEDAANYAMWKSDFITTDLLDAFHSILENIGLDDCSKPDNAPFSYDGKIAFIDTETYHSWPVKYRKMTPHLFTEMKLYWKRLTKHKK